MSTTGTEAMTDGRRRRSHDSRARIVRAMLELVDEGQISPPAEQVAARAGVGLRSVFRHFADMDSLYREMSQVIEVELRAAVQQPFEGANERARVVELVRRRAEAYERVGAYKRASAAHRHRSRVLEADQARFVAIAREILRLHAPGGLDPLRFEAIDALLSFEMWERLRREQRLSRARAVAVLELAVGRLLDG